MCYNAAVLSPVCPKFAYFASILLFAFASLFLQFFCRQNRCIPSTDSTLSQKVIERQTKYLELKIELSRVWKCRKVCIIPIVIGALGSIPRDLSLQLEKLQLPSSLIQTFQKTILNILHCITIKMILVH